MERWGYWAGGALTVVVAGWLAGYWVVFDGWWHRRLFWWIVMPVAAVALPVLGRRVKLDGWCRTVGALLGFQALSHLWSSGDPAAPTGGWVDTLALAVLVGALFVLARSSRPFQDTIPRLLALVSTLAMASSLVVFYASRDFAEDRFRNIFVYESGLNPVLTGLLGSTAALMAVACYLAMPGARWHLLWLGVTALHIFALCATQSRTAMLALGAGLVTFTVVERRRMMVPLAVVAVAAGIYYAAVFLLPGGGASVGDLLDRGTTGRWSIYREFLAEMSTRDYLIGRGMGTPAELPDERLGWHVHHPHNSYLTQFYLTGVIGLGLLGAVLFEAVRRAAALVRDGRALWLALLVGNGLALAVDGAQIFSLQSIPRLEFLLLAVPAAVACGLFQKPVAIPNVTEPPDREE